MQSSLTRIALSLGILFLGATGLPAHADPSAAATPAAVIPIADFFNNAAFNGAVMSPDGRHLAVLVSAKGGRVQLYTVELPSMKVNGLT